jgi:hypothetical protein
MARKSKKAQAQEQAQQTADVAAQATNDVPGDAGDQPKPKGKGKAASGGKSAPKGKTKGAGKPKAKKSGPPKRSRKPQAPGGKLAPSKSAPKPPKDAAAPAGVMWRLATITNEKSGRELTLELRKDGRLVPSDVRRTGIERVPEWIEVRAPSRVEALQKIDAGGGQRFKWTGKKIVEA